MNVEELKNILRLIDDGVHRLDCFSAAVRRVYIFREYLRLRKISFTVSAAREELANRFCMTPRTVEKVIYSNNNVDPEILKLLNE